MAWVRVRVRIRGRVRVRVRGDSGIPKLVNADSYLELVLLCFYFQDFY